MMEHPTPYTTIKAIQLKNYIIIKSWINKLWPTWKLSLYGLKFPKCNLTYPNLLIIGRIINNEALENNGGE
jgi:hypothetical protein